MKQEELAESLIRMIETGEYVQDGKFLSERRLMEKFKIGRSTVRGALQLLIGQGYIYQVHGKGTFVKSANPSTSIYSITNSNESIVEEGMTPELSVVSKELIKAGRKVAGELHIHTGDQVLKLKILRSANGKPVNYTVSYIPMLPLFKGLVGFNFTDESITEHLRHCYHIIPAQTVHHVQPVLPRTDIAELLETPQNLPILLFESTTWGRIDELVFPVEYFQCYHTTERSRFTYIQNHGIF